VLARCRILQVRRWTGARALQDPAGVLACCRILQVWRRTGACALQDPAAVEVEPQSF
jgi:hypothetical protein